MCAVLVLAAKLIHFFMLLLALPVKITPVHVLLLGQSSGSGTWLHQFLWNPTSRTCDLTVEPSLTHMNCYCTQDGLIFFLFIYYFHLHIFAVYL